MPGNDAGLLVAKANNLKIAGMCDKLFKAGVPDEKRLNAWFEITNAKSVAGTMNAVQYRALVKSVDSGNNTASILQLDEDYHTLMAEGRSPFPETQQFHENHLREARDVCRALIAFSTSGRGTGLHLANFQGSHGIAYCRALLYIAYYLSLLSKPEEEYKIFFIMFSIIGHAENRVFEDYHGMPKPAQRMNAQLPQSARNLCSHSAAMADVCYLDTALSIYEPELATKLSSSGFHCSMFFYMAFMRFFATVLPELTLFRLWDRLFYETTAQGPPRGNSDPHSVPPPQRAVFVELAFGAMVQTTEEGGMGLRENLMACSSSAEILDCLNIGFLIYDVDLVGELIEYGKARLGASQNPVSKTLMEAAFADKLSIYKNFANFFNSQTATVSTLINKPGSIGGTDRVAQLDTVTIHKVLCPKVRTYFKSPGKYQKSKHDVLVDLKMEHLIKDKHGHPLPSPSTSEPIDPHRWQTVSMDKVMFGGFFRPYPRDVLEINQSIGNTAALKIVKGSVSSLFGIKKGGQIMKPILIDVTPDQKKGEEKASEKLTSLGIENTEETLLDYEGFIKFMGELFPEFKSQHKTEIDQLFEYHRGIPEKPKEQINTDLRNATTARAAKERRVRVGFGAADRDGHPFVRNCLRESSSTLSPLLRQGRWRKNKCCELPAFEAPVGGFNNQAHGPSQV
jgi:hypothetical protein